MKGLMCLCCILMLFSCFLVFKVSIQYVKINQLTYEIKKRDEYEAKLNRMIDNNLKLMSKGGWESLDE